MSLFRLTMAQVQQIVAQAVPVPDPANQGYWLMDLTATPLNTVITVQAPDAPTAIQDAATALEALASDAPVQPDETMVLANGLVTVGVLTAQQLSVIYPPPKGAAGNQVAPPV